jgi:hypothetical protein
MTSNTLSLSAADRTDQKREALTRMNLPKALRTTGNVGDRILKIDVMEEIGQWLTFFNREDSSKRLKADDGASPTPVCLRPNGVQKLSQPCTRLGELLALDLVLQR